MKILDLLVKTEVPIKLAFEERINKRDPIIRERIIREGIKETKKSQSEFRHAAIIFDGNRIISKGYNIPFKTHPKGSGIYTSIHAEVMAITSAIKNRKNIDNLDILIIRMNKRNQFLLSKPCKDCMKLIKRFNINPIWSH